MKFRVCVPVFVPGTVAHALHDEPLNFVKRIEFAASEGWPLMTNSHTLAPSVAPKIPAPALKAWPDAKAGGAGDSVTQLLFAAEYDAPLTAVPFLRNA